MFNVNLFSPWLLISAFAKQLPEGTHGKVINISDGSVFHNGTDHFGYRVTKLDRVYFAGLTKKNLPRGRWRYLTQEEVNYLKMGSFE